MSEASATTYQLRVASIRSRKRHGVLFSGFPIGGSGVQDNRQRLVVKVTGAQHAGIEIGQLWQITGDLTTQTIRVNGVVRKEPLLIAKDLYLLKPSGSQIIRWIAENKDIAGIGHVKAQKLWDALGEDLYTALDERDPTPLERTIRSPEIVQRLLDAWARDGDSATLRWMQKHHVPLDLARKVIRFHGKETLNKLREDPYRLLSFCTSWQQVDAMARDKLGVADDDPRRLGAAVEQALYEQLDNGHTVADETVLKRPVKALLGSAGLAAKALTLAIGNKAIKQSADGRYHSAGAWIMERTVTEFVRRRIDQPAQRPLFADNADEILDAFEHHQAQATGIAGFKLNEAQRAAIKRSFEHGFSVITGSAGVGKTTVLKALYRLLDTTGLPRYQMALTGRAARRMAEATGEPASTIAGFLKHVPTRGMGDSPVVIIDEASMVDLATLYRLVRKLPAQCRMVLIGDPYQLPPIGAGLVLHGLVGLDAVPVSELTVVKRQAADSAIPGFANAVRNGTWPEGLSSHADAQVVALGCDNHQLVDTVLSLYEADRAHTQILCPTRANPYSGFKTISRACCWRYTASQDRRPLRLYDEDTGFYEGDLLLYTRNDWQRDLQNGSLGRLVEAFPCPRLVATEADQSVEAIGWAEWEGRGIPLLASDVEWLEHGYAISIHKAQGSQFRRVIVPVTQGRLLDRTLIYTAITRAQEQVILVGDLGAARRAVIAPPRAHLRRVALPSMVERSLGQGVGAARSQSEAAARTRPLDADAAPYPAGGL